MQQKRRPWPRSSRLTIYAPLRDTVRQWLGIWLRNFSINCPAVRTVMVKVLARWNFLPAAAAVNEILPCCGSTAWAAAMVARRPLPEETTLLNTSDEIWSSLAEADWLEAFRSHPRIGESRPGESK